jgi:predicted GIY-YIG superfamily endonuclease
MSSFYGQAGIIYLIHFHQPYKHAKHYLGFTSDLVARVDRHWDGHGSRLMAVVTEHDIDWEVVRTWKGTRGDERKLKRQKNSCRLCPVCCGQAALS